MSATAAANEPAESTWRTLRRGLALSPELRTGLAGTLALATASMVGRAAVPVAVQQGIDRGLRAPGGPDIRLVAAVVAVTAAVLVVTTLCGYLMMRRLFTVSETALAGVRTRAFRHVHDLSMLHQQSERRGSLVSRVTSDVDQISQFLQWGGVILLISIGQVTVTAMVMAVYSWQLTLVVFAAFLPAFVVIRAFQKRLAAAYGLVRQRTGAMLAAVAESVVGAPVIRAYGVSRRTARRLEEAIENQRRAQQRAIRTSVISFSTGEIAAGLALAAVVVLGVWLGVGEVLTVGELTAFLFLVTLFIQPVQIATEVLNEAQNAIAGWRRVLDVLDVSPDVADPGDEGVPLPAGPIDIRFVDVNFAYPVAAPASGTAGSGTAANGAAAAKGAAVANGVAANGVGTKGEGGKGAAGNGRAATGAGARGATSEVGSRLAGAPVSGLGPPVLSDVTLDIPAKTRVAIVGETGGGKTTLAKLLTRLMDPTDGQVVLSGVPLDRIHFSSLRSRVVMVPQDGFLFDSTVGENVRFGRPTMTDRDVTLAFTELGLADWVEGLPKGLDTPVGERGEALSVGERQLVALARAYVADPDLLVLDEATSAVDPATEVRLQRTLDAVTRGRTTVAIAHRLSTAQAADEVIVVDRGRIVQRGPHTELLRDPASVYAKLYASWLEQTR